MIALTENSTHEANSIKMKLSVKVNFAKENEEGNVIDFPCFFNAGPETFYQDEETEKIFDAMYIKIKEHFENPALYDSNV